MKVALLTAGVLCFGLTSYLSAQVPPVEGHTCVAGCPGGGPSGVERPEPQPHPQPVGPSPAELARLDFDRATQAYQSAVDRLNSLISKIRSAGFDPAVRESVLTIFGEDRQALAAGPAVRPATSFSIPHLVSPDFPVMEVDIRRLMTAYPGLASADLYRSDLSPLGSRTAAFEDRTRRLQALRGELQNWYAAHSVPQNEADYRRRLADIAQRIDDLDQRNGKLFAQARSFAQRGTATAQAALRRLGVPVPEGFPGGDAQIFAAADGFANERAPAASGVANVSASNFPRGPREMPDWRAVGPRMAPWYSRYADHFYVDGGRSMVIASADLVPQPAGPAKVTLAALPADRARAQIGPEISRLSQQIEQLSDAVGSYNEKHARYAATVANYNKQAQDMAEYAKPAFQALHLDVLNALADERLRASLKSLYGNLYEAARAEAWQVLAEATSRLPPVPAARQEALKGAIKLVPAVQDLAQNEFAEIMKGPAAIVQGDEQQVVEIQSRMSAHICELMSGYTPLMQKLPAFVTPYLSEKSCGDR